MKTKILYVLVSNDNDVYWEQTYISLTTLRKYMPEVHVSLLTDDVTDATFVGVRAKINELLSEKVVVPLDSKLSNKVRSRLLKTNMRNLVDGDFLFVDADTIILRSLEDIDECPYEMGAVLETHKRIGNNSNKQHIIEGVERFGLKLNDDDKYYNSGVFYVKDNDRTRAFFKRWLECWKEGVEKHNVMFDQQSLAVVNHEFENIIQELSGEWNCLGKYCINYVREARLFHYFYDSFFDFPMIKKNIFMNLKNTGEIDDSILEIIEDPFKAISGTNELVTGKMEEIIHTRLFAILRRQYYSHRRFFNIIEGIVRWVYEFNLRTFKKNRKIAPPRKH